MEGILTLVIYVAMVVACFKIGKNKGYSGILCGVLGALGPLVLIVLLFLPNKRKAAEEAAARDREQQRKMDAMSARIRELENAQKKAEASAAAPAPKAKTETKPAAAPEPKKPAPAPAPAPVPKRENVSKMPEERQLMNISAYEATGIARSGDRAYIRMLEDSVPFHGSADFRGLPADQRIDILEKLVILHFEDFSNAASFDLFKELKENNLINVSNGSVIGIGGTFGRKYREFKEMAPSQQVCAKIDECVAALNYLIKALDNMNRHMIFLRTWVEPNGQAFKNPDDSSTTVIVKYYEELRDKFIRAYIEVWKNTKEETRREQSEPKPEPKPAAKSAKELNAEALACEKQDPARALSLFEQAAEMGFASAQYNCGILYYDGRGCTQDYEKAFDWFKEAAEQGGADAMYLCGKILREIAMTYVGKGTREAWDARDTYMNGARIWFEKAAAQGYTAAQVELGKLLMVNGDKQEARRWFEKAAPESEEARFWVEFLKKEN